MTPAPGTAAHKLWLKAARDSARADAKHQAVIDRVRRSVEAAKAALARQATR